MTEKQQEEIDLLKELIAESSTPNDEREIYQKALTTLLSRSGSEEPKVAKKMMPKKEKATPKTKATKKPKATKPAQLPSDVEAMKKQIKERTGKTESECEDIIAQYRMLRNKAKVNGAKRIAKLKNSDDLIAGTNVITPVAQIEKDAEIVKAKIEKQVEQIENKAERQVVTKDKTKDEVKIAVEKKVIKELAKLSDDMVLKSTTFVKNIQTELKKVDKTEAKNFLLGLRNEIDALLSKFGDGGTTEIYNIAEMNSSSSSVNPSKFARGGGVNLRKAPFKVGDMVYSYQNPNHKMRVAFVEDRGIEDGVDYGWSIRVALKTDANGTYNPNGSYSQTSKYMSQNSVSKTKKEKYENGGEVGEFALGGGVMSDGRFKLRGFPAIDKAELMGLYEDFKENFSSNIERFTKSYNKVHDSKLRLSDVKELMDYAKLNFDNKMATGGVLANNEIMQNIEFEDDTDTKFGRYNFSFDTIDSEGANMFDYDGYIIVQPSSSRQDDEIEWGQNVPEDYDKAESILIDAFYKWKNNKMADGGLIGNQKRIDLNENGKIDAEDFKLLRSSMNGAWRKEHKYVNSTSRNKQGKLDKHEIRYAKKNNPSRTGYKGKTNYARGGFVSKAELVWRKLSSSDRINFLIENFTPEITPRSQEILVGKSYNFLPKKVKIVLASKYANVEEYAGGGQVMEIQKIKNKLISKAKSKGIYENFGQNEVRMLEDKYGNTNEVREFDRWAMNFDMSDLKQYAGGGGIEDSPRIYVADLEAYNNGRLNGEWLSLTDYNNADELMEAIQELLDKWGVEEYAIHDTEYIPSNLSSEYMGQRDFEQLYEMIDLANEYNLPLEVVQDVVSQYDSSAVEEYIGKYDNTMDFAEQQVDEVGLENFSSPEYYVYMTDTDRRLLAGDMSDSYVEDIKNEDGGNRVIEEAGLDVSEYEEADSERQEEMVDEAVEIVREEYYDTWYDGLSDPYEFLVEQQGMYSPEDFFDANFISVDYEKIASALEDDYTFIYDSNSDLYVFNIR